MPGLQTIRDSILGAAITALCRCRQPRIRGALRLRGLEAPVEVLRDRWGVPHIYAANTHDLLFAQGYVHAQDRLWQMDFSRRLAAGRLAEVLGAAALPADRWLRILGLRRVAEEEARLLEPAICEAAEAYAAGVDACLAREPLPVEFALLRYRPEPWTVADSLSWAKMMAWSLSVNWESELLRARLIARLGPELAAELEPASVEGCPYVVPPGLDYSAIGHDALARARQARRRAGPSATEGLGSNNWVLAGSRTATGAPLLANDMHLFMGLPAAWYENHLCGGDLDVTGITFPGIPGVVSGHNGRVAWGFTNAFPDVQDLYIEHLRRLDDGRVQYEFMGAWLDARVIREEIRVRGADAVVEEVVVTRHGPIVNALAPAAAGDQPLALRWTSLEPDNMLRALYRMNRAHTCIEFREALRDWAAPAQNTVYADTLGNIAYSHAGRVPIRARGDGRVPVPGWTGEYEWVGYIPFEELPHLYNPAPGYIATANNRVAREDYPYHLSSDYCLGDRAQRIVELIEDRERIDLDYVRKMQFDQVSLTAQVLARYLGGVEVGEPELAEVVDLMGSWHGALSAGSAAAAVYEVLLPRLMRLMLASRLGDLVDRYLGRGPTPVLAESSIFIFRAMEWLRQTLPDPHSPWFNLGHGETRDDVLCLALRETVSYLQETLGPGPGNWAWGKLHRVTWAHTLGRVPPLARLLNRGPYPVGGDGTTVWATGAATPDLQSEGIIGPPFRFIADLGDLQNSWGLLAPGQSGRPGNPHYDDQVAAWFAGDYHPMLYARADVERETQARLHLLPAL